LAFIHAKCMSRFAPFLGFSHMLNTYHFAPINFWAFIHGHFNCVMPSVTLPTSVQNLYLKSHTYDILNHRYVFEVRKNRNEVSKFNSICIFPFKPGR